MKVSVPSRGELCLTWVTVNGAGSIITFPAPLEVDKFLYFMQKQFTNTKSYDSFRPLAR